MEGLGIGDDEKGREKTRLGRGEVYRGGRNRLQRKKVPRNRPADTPPPFPAPGDDRRRLHEGGKQDTLPTPLTPRLHLIPMPPARVICCLLVLLAFAGAGAGELQRREFKGTGMYTQFRIVCYTATQEEAEKAAAACFDRVQELNARLTDYDPTSELMRLCADDGPAYPRTVSSDLFQVISRALDLARLTEGAFDPTCGHLSNLWRRARRRHELPPADRLAEAARLTDWRQVVLNPESRAITLPPQTLLDLGGIAKGWAADDCLRLLHQRGVTRALVQAGGDTAAGDAPPGAAGWEVKLRTFQKPGAEDTLETVLLANRAVSTSGDLYQYLELQGVRYSHIISPRTGQALTRRVACSVFAPDCATSDGLSTAMCVLGPEAGRELAAKIPGVEVRFAEPPAVDER